MITHPYPPQKPKRAMKNAVLSTAEHWEEETKQEPLLLHKKSLGALDSFFRISERGSDVRTELFAGFVNFLANSYLLVLTPQLLHHGASTKRGFADKVVSLTGFVAGTVSASLLFGLTSNLPIAAGPGVGVAAYFAYGLSNEQDPSPNPSSNSNLNREPTSGHNAHPNE